MKTQEMTPGQQYAYEYEIDLTRDALYMARNWGFAVFPLRPGMKEPYGGKHGFKEASRDAADIRAMFTKHPHSNLAIACGSVSQNLGVIDLDKPKHEGEPDGLNALIAWQEEHGKLPETVTVETGSGGRHLYYRFPAGVPRCYANGRIHVDFRGEGGYVMAPGSIHPNGREVGWDDDPYDVDIAEADENVLAFIEQHSPKAQKRIYEAQRFELPENVGEGMRDVTLFKYACSLRARNVERAEAEAKLIDYNRHHCFPPMDEDTVLRKVESAYSHPAGSTWEQQYEEPDTIGAKSIWDNPYLEKRFSSKGEFLGYHVPSIAALVWWMQEDPGLVGVRLERMSQQIICQNGLPWRAKAKQWRNIDDSHLFSRMQERYKYRGRTLVNRDKDVEKAFGIFTDKNSFDALEKMLDSMPDWDGNDRAEMLLIDWLGAEDTPYVRAVTRLMLKAAIARAYNPGCKFDYMVVLQGPQGIGKSYLLRQLAMNDDFFIDDVKNIGNKEAQELIQGGWIIEMAELAAFKGKQVETLKSFITCQTDTYRVPYSKRPEQMPRRCILVGTTNANEYLEDQTGNRRFLPIRCSGEVEEQIFDPGFRRYYLEQVWAEALADYRTSNRLDLTLDKRVFESAEEARAQATVEDDWIGLVQNYLMGKEEGALVCISQILAEALGTPKGEAEMRDSKRVASIIDTYCKEWVRLRSNRCIPGYGPQRAFKKMTLPEAQAKVAAEHKQEQLDLDSV